MARLSKPDRACPSASPACKLHTADGTDPHTRPRAEPQRRWGGDPGLSSRQAASQRKPRIDGLPEKAESPSMSRSTECHLISARFDYLLPRRGPQYRGLRTRLYRDRLTQIPSVAQIKRCCACHGQGVLADFTWRLSARSSWPIRARPCVREPAEPGPGAQHEQPEHVVVGDKGRSNPVSMAIAPITSTPPGAKANSSAAGGNPTIPAAARRRPRPRRSDQGRNHAGQKGPRQAAPVEPGEPGSDQRAHADESGGAQPVASPPGSGRSHGPAPTPPSPHNSATGIPSRLKPRPTPSDKLTQHQPPGPAAPRAPHRPAPRSPRPPKGRSARARAGSASAPGPIAPVRCAAHRRATSGRTGPEIAQMARGRAQKGRHPVISEIRGAAPLRTIISDDDQGHGQHRQATAARPGGGDHLGRHGAPICTPQHQERSRLRSPIAYGCAAPPAWRSTPCGGRAGQHRLPRTDQPEQRRAGHADTKVRTVAQLRLNRRHGSSGRRGGVGPCCGPP